MNKFPKIFVTIISAFAIPQMLSAQAAAAPAHSLYEPVALVMVSIAIILLPVIFVLSKAVFISYDYFKRNNVPKAAAVIIALLFVSPAFATDAEVVAANAPALIGGLSQTTFYFLAAIIALELIIVLFLLRTFRLFARVKKVVEPQTAGAKEKKKRFAWLEKLNNTKSVDADSEAAVNLGHDYDGIGELDNPTPPWWQWGFVISIIFAVVYMYTHHVSKTAPLQLQELSIANEKAEKQLAAYLANSANNIDEHNVKLLTESSDLLEGKELFTAACAACHAVDGGGLVGPNLTDKYWKHGGSINDIFKTIKYGVPEKGMKSWKDDYSPKQIARIASYIQTLQGTTPADPKDPEGELYEGDAQNESVAVTD